jgi:ABC-type oligopeptide transport system substrate-binding subunit
MDFKYLIFIILVWLIAIISGCEPQPVKQQTQTTTEKQVEQERVNYLRLPLKNPVVTLDPGWAYMPAQIEIVEQLFLGLTSFDPKTYEVVPKLASSWQVNKKGTVYTFKLRQDVKWTDGKPVTAHDIAWAIRRHLTEELDSPLVFLLYPIKNAEKIHLQHRADNLALEKDDALTHDILRIEEKNEPINSPSSKVSQKKLGVWAINDYTIEFKLNQPMSSFPVLVGLWPYRPLPRHLIAKYGDRWYQPDNIQTNGPYKLTDWQKGKQLILSKNPHYYDAEKVTLSEVHYHIVPKSSLALAMYEKNELDMIGGPTYLYLPEREIPRIKLDPVLRREMRTTPHFCTEWYGFNTQLPPMDTPLVRKAIAAAIDKRILIEVILQENHSRAMTFTRPPTFGSVPPEAKKGIQFNPRQARAWLAKAGYPDGEGFPKVVLVHHVSKEHQKVANGIKTMLKYYLNIEVEVREIEWVDYLGVLEQLQDVHLFRMGWCADYPDADNWLYEVFHPQKGINWIKWQNPQFAELVDKARRFSHPKQRQDLYLDAEQILIEEEVAIVPLYFATTQFLVKPWVKNWYYMAFGGQQVCNWALEN